jgi:hypothetical protein
MGHASPDSLLSARELIGRQGDDRNQTGVDGFAVRWKGMSSAYLSGF